MPYGNNKFNYYAGLSLSFDSFGSFRIRLGFDCSQNINKFYVAAGTGVTYHVNAYSTQKNGFELRGSLMAGYDNGDLSARLGTNWWKGFGSLREFDQRTGILDFKYRKFYMSYENDGFPFGFLKTGDGYDRYRTAAFRIGYDDFYIGANLFTGSRTIFKGDDEKVGKAEIGNFNTNMPNGFVIEDGTPYRMGKLHIGYKQYRFGIDSDKYVRHPIQDIFAHDTYLAPFGIGLLDTRQPGFQTLSDEIKPYFEINPSFIPSDKLKLNLPNFTLYD